MMVSIIFPCLVSNVANLLFYDTILLVVARKLSRFWKKVDFSFSSGRTNHVTPVLRYFMV